MLAALSAAVLNASSVAVSVHDAMISVAKAGDLAMDTPASMSLILEWPIRGGDVRNARVDTEPRRVGSG